MTDNTEYQLIEDRLISGKGILNMPQGSEWRDFLLYIDVLRDSPVVFDSQKFNPSKSEYAKITGIKQEYVISEFPVNYKKQRFRIPAQDEPGYLLPYLDCNFTGVGDALFAIAVAVGLSPVPRDVFYEVSPIRYDVDRFNIVCRGSTLLQVRLYGLEVHRPCAEALDKKKFSPQVPDPLPPVPVNEGVGVTPPYVEPDDNGNTVPDVIDTIDQEPLLPAGSQCQQVRVTYQVVSIDNNTGQEVTTTDSVLLFGEVQDVYQVPSPPTVRGTSINRRAVSRGIVGATACGGVAERTFSGSSGDVPATVSFTVTAVELL